MQINRGKAEELDGRDPLGDFRDEFVLRPGLIYLDGNSLGPMHASVRERMRACIEDEWANDLIASWNTAGWYDMPLRLGARIAPLIGAGANDVVVTDSTSINLFKVLAAAIRLNPGRKIIVSERSNFPTDLYMVEGLSAFAGQGHELRLVDTPEDVTQAIDESVAVVMLTHVNYRTGRVHDMADITKRAHQSGALVVWDLAHSTGALPVDLAGADADFAVGCTYKYLNGGPGAPAFVYVAPRLQTIAEQPLSGWFGHSQPFAFDPSFEPAETIHRFLTGTPPVLSMTALEPALAIWDRVDIAAVRVKSVQLCEYFIALVEEECAGFGLELASPRDSARRGSQVSFRHENAYAVMQALISRDVVGDFRAPDIMRFGFAPLYIRFVDVFDAVATLSGILRSEAWRDDRFQVRSAVT